jgi:hypothetical protein
MKFPCPSCNHMVKRMDGSSIERKPAHSSVRPPAAVGTVTQWENELTDSVYRRRTYHCRNCSTIFSTREDVASIKIVQRK